MFTHLSTQCHDIACKRHPLTAISHANTRRCVARKKLQRQFNLPIHVDAAINRHVKQENEAGASCTRTDVVIAGLGVFFRATQAERSEMIAKGRMMKREDFDGTHDEVTPAVVETPDAEGMGKKIVAAASLKAGRARRRAKARGRSKNAMTG